MYNILPPMSGQDFWQHDRDPALRVFLKVIFNVVQEGTQNGTIRRGNDDQGNPTAPLSPLHLHQRRFLWIHIHKECAHLSSSAPRIINSADHCFVDCSYGNDDQISPWARWS